jgi:putative hydrolase of the HAD superfamily
LNVTALKAVIFDMDGTLLEWKDPTTTLEQVALIQFNAVRQTLVERGYTQPQAHDFAPVLYAKAGTNWREAMRTCRSYTVYDLLEEALPQMGLGVTGEDLAACVTAFESIPDPTGPRDDALPTLTALQAAKLRLGLISNSWSTPASRDEELYRAGLLELLEVRVYSSDMDVMKPHPAIFNRGLAELGVAASQAAMVGDILEMDIAGAQRVGMRAIWLDARGRGLPEDAPVRPDARIEQLGELIDVLGRWTGS